MTEESWSCWKRPTSENFHDTGSEQQSEYLKCLADESCGLFLRHVWAVPLAKERPCEVIAKPCTSQACHTSEASWTCYTSANAPLQLNLGLTVNPHEAHEAHGTKWIEEILMNL